MAKTTTDAVEILKRTSGIDPDTDPEMLQIPETPRGFRGRAETGRLATSTRPIV